MERNNEMCPRSSNPVEVSDPSEVMKISATKEAKDVSSSAKNVIWPMWSNFTENVHARIRYFLVILSLSAARYPKVTLVTIPILSFFLVAVGFFTNFELVVDAFEAFAPTNSNAVIHKNWEASAGFLAGRNPFLMMVHADGDNIANIEGIRRVIQAVNVIQDTPGFDEVCVGEDSYDLDTCEILSVGGFWWHNLTVFENEIESDEDVHDALMGKAFRDGFPVDPINYVDTASVEASIETQSMDSAKAYFIFVLIRKTDITEEFERDALANVLNLREHWENEDGNNFMVEVNSVAVSPVQEMNQAIINDLPLMPVVGFVMSVFTCLVFFRWDKVKSRMVLGVGSVITIGFSLMSGFGLLFIFGVPYTNMTTLLPFIVFGVGLDDTFIITGHFFRTDSKLDPLERLADTISTVGMSIFVTTLTTSLAFILGLISNIPAIFWLCLYAFPTIIIDFIYQITFFVAILILDERRIQQNRMDVCICCTVSNNKDTSEGDNDVSLPTASAESSEQGNNNEDSFKSLPDRFMIWYSNILMRTWAKALVIFSFVVLLAGCIYSTTKLYQAFDPTDLVPEDSYLRVFAGTWADHQTRSTPVTAYFRDVDQSDPYVQEQMLEYLDELESMKYFGRPSEFCWIKDWPQLSSILPDDMPFNEKLDVLLDIPLFKKVYGRTIVRDEISGNITTSYCQFHTYGLDMNSIKDQIEFLHDQRSLAAAQPFNEGVKSYDWPFFTYDPYFIFLEFYAVHVNELISTTVAGLLAVTVVTLFFLPHWSAVAIVLPTMMVLYIDLIGAIQFSGLHMNVVTFVILVVSIGLLVDFVIHILLCYYESTAPTREEKAKDALRTLGSSVLVGGISTFLGVLPLALSTSAIIQTVYICFFAMIVLGVSHGLILLPVILSIFGPENVSSVSERELITYGISAQPLDTERTVKSEKAVDSEANDDVVPEVPTLDSSLDDEESVNGQQ